MKSPALALIAAVLAGCASDATADERATPSACATLPCPTCETPTAECSWESVGRITSWDGVALDLVSIAEVRVRGGPTWRDFNHSATLTLGGVSIDEANRTVRSEPGLLPAERAGVVRWDTEAYVGYRIGSAIGLTAGDASADKGRPVAPFLLHVNGHGVRWTGRYDEPCIRDVEAPGQPPLHDERSGLGDFVLDDTDGEIRIVFGGPRNTPCDPAEITIRWLGLFARDEDAEAS